MIAVKRAVRIGDVRISEQARLNVLSALASDRLTYGRWQEDFENRFAAIHGRSFACFVNSGTDALRLGLLAAKERYGWEDGARVALPAVTFPATLNVVWQARLEPYLVDIELEHFGMNHLAVPADAVAMMPVHLFGHVSPVAGHLSGLGLRVVADSCQTAFMPGCASGAVSCFSTYSAHLIATGVGGLATTDDPELAALIRSLANHGRSGVYASIDAPLGRREIMEARFCFEREGYSSRGTELQAAIGCAELDEWARNLARRRRNAALLRAGLAGLPLRLPQYPVADSAWMVFPILAPSREARDMLLTGLELSGVETRPLFPLISQPYVRRRFGDMHRQLPVAHLVGETGFYIGCHQYLDDDDIAHVIETLRRLHA